MVIKSFELLMFICEICKNNVKYNIEYQYVCWGKVKVSGRKRRGMDDRDGFLQESSFFLVVGLV